MAQKSDSSWVKWLLIGCGGCLVLGILIAVLLFVAVKSAFQKGAFYQEPPAVAVADKVNNVDAINVFFDVKTAEEAGFKKQKITISEGEFNAFLKNALETLPESKASPAGPPMRFLIDLKNDQMDLYMSVEGAKASPGMSWMKVGYLVEYDIVKDTLPISIELRDMKMGSNVLPASQWKTQAQSSVQAFRNIGAQNLALGRVFEMMQRGLVLSRDIIDLVVTNDSLTFTVK